MELKDSLNGNILESDRDLRTSIVEEKLGKKALIVLSVIFLISLILLIVGITLISKGAKSCGETKLVKAGKQTGGYCQYSDEAKRIGLEEFLQKVQSVYFKLHPENTVWHPKATTDMVRKEYRAYDASPEAIKRRTDTAMELLKEIKSKIPNYLMMKSREYKALTQVKHYLKYVFGQPFDGNYYSGAWMLGPTSLCWVPMCALGSDIYNNIGNIRPRTVEDIHLVIGHFKDIERTVIQYQKNIELGIKTGMVRTKKECEGGLAALGKQFQNISEQGETGVVNEWYGSIFTKEMFLKDLPQEARDRWTSTTGKMVNESLREALITYVGKPVYKLLRFLAVDHYQHCRPDSEWAGGLSALPIDYVYVNGTADKSQKTTKTLPLKDENGKYPVINGTETYGMILGYFTTTDMTPDEIFDIGQKRLKILYSQAKEIAMNVTGERNETKAIELFQEKLLDLKSSYFNEIPIPKNESEGDAFQNCNTIEKAKINCPNRWKAMEAWFSFARKVMSKLDPKTVDMFYFTGEKHTTPNCPIDLRPDFNPTTAAQSYEGSDSSCSHRSIYNIPFFLQNAGPKYSEYSVNAHEARPGHHTQVQGNTEHFRDKCEGSIKWLDDQTYYTAFTEGWGLYAENPLIAKNTDTYDEEPMQKYGMLKWQIWRALRLMVDTGMHARNMSRGEAENYFATYAWDKTDLADKEITRYQSNPGQALGYMLGQLEIVRLREYAEKELGKDFSLQEFHYQALGQGSSPLSFLSEHIKQFVACKKEASKKGCDQILNPPSKPLVPDNDFVSDLILQKPRRRHYI